MNYDTIYSSKNYIQIIWNTGIKCTYDCSYCPDFRHSLDSKFDTLDRLIKSADFIIRYARMIKNFNDIEVDVNLTGGEPSANPFLEDILETLSQSKDLVISMTTNGFWPEEKLNLISKYIHNLRFSYHAEATQEQKVRVIQNIEKSFQITQEENTHLKTVGVNVMMHEDPELFKDCSSVIEKLRFIGLPENRIKIRTIDRSGSQTSYRLMQKSKIKNSNFDTIQDKSRLKYSDSMLKQIKVLTGQKKELQVQKVPGKSRVHGVNGRACCSAGIRLTSYDSKTGDSDTSKMLSNRNYQGWNCMVLQDWLNIEQDENAIYSHQTCRANTKNEQGSLCTIDDADQFMNKLENYYSKGIIPTVTCPNTICNCGICASKSKDPVMFQKFVEARFPGFQYKNVSELDL